MDMKKIANKEDKERLADQMKKIPESIREMEYIEIGYRPWGVYYVLEDKPQYKVKKIIVNPGQRLSLQSHTRRSEHWVVVSGTATVEIRSKDEKNIGPKTIKANESCYVPKNYLHRLSNNHKEPLVIIEVQCGEYTGEDDITRYEDDYKRAN